MKFKCYEEGMTEAHAKIVEADGPNARAEAAAKFCEAASLNWMIARNICVEPADDEARESQVLNQSVLPCVQQ